MSYPIKPVNADILFVFTDDVTHDGIFKESTDWGFEIKLDETRGAGHRFANVVAVGPKCSTVAAGMTVVVESLMWTKQLDVYGKQCWKTDESKILALVEND